jgi:hypothetical protein
MTTGRINQVTTKSAVCLAPRGRRTGPLVKEIESSCGIAAASIYPAIAPAAPADNK